MAKSKYVKTNKTFAQACNDKASRDDCLITLNVMRERRELDGVSWWIVLPTYTLFLICLCVRLSNYRTFQKIPSCDLSCDQVVWPSYLILSPFSIFRTLRLVHLRIALVLPIPPTVLSLVLAGDLWQSYQSKHSKCFKNQRGLSYSSNTKNHRNA